TRFSRDWSSDVCSSDLRGFQLKQTDVARLVAGMVGIQMLNTNVPLNLVKPFELLFDFSIRTSLCFQFCFLGIDGFFERILVFLDRTVFTISHRGRERSAVATLGVKKPRNGPLTIRIVFVNF